MRVAALTALCLLLQSSPAHAEANEFPATITAYCLTGLTYSGRPAGPGLAAVDPSVIPLGTRLEIEGLPGSYLAADIGGGVHGAHVDVWMDCESAIDWGRQTRLVTFP